MTVFVAVCIAFFCMFCIATLCTLTARVSRLEEAVEYRVSRLEEAVRELRAKLKGGR